MKIPYQPAYFVASFLTSATSMQEVQSKYPDAIAAHVVRSQEFQKKGTLLMAGAVNNGPGEAVSTLGIFTTREAAEEFAQGDPFVLNGMAVSWSIKPWANILKDL